MAGYQNQGDIQLNSGDFLRKVPCDPQVNLFKNFQCDLLCSGKYPVFLLGSIILLLLGLKEKM